MLYNCFNVLTSSQLDHKLFERKKPQQPSLENLAQCWASNKQLQLYLQQKVSILAETSFLPYFALNCDTRNLTYLTCQVCNRIVTARTLHNASYLLFSETGSLECVGVGNLRKKRHRTKADTAPSKEQNHPDSRHKFITQATRDLCMI